MTNQYPQLTYAGDVTGSVQATPGHLLGMDEVGRFYEVIDAELSPEQSDNPDDYGCNLCGRIETHTHVNLQYATAESLKRAAAGQEA